MQNFLGWVVLVLALCAPLIGAWLWWKLLRGKNGERYLRQYTQGPWIPSGKNKDE